MADLCYFSLAKIAEFIKEFSWDGINPNFTEDDLKHCHGPLMQKLYYNFLIEFGFDLDITQAKFEDLDENQELYQHMLPLINLKACLSWLLGKLMPGPDCPKFMLQDLTHPVVKRSQQFLSILKNFWIFCNMNIYPTVQMIENEMEGYIKMRTDLTTDIEKLKTEWNNLMAKDVGDQEELASIQNKINEIGGEIETMKPKISDVKRDCLAMAAELEQREAAIQEINDRVRSRETDCERLRESVEKDHVIRSLQEEMDEMERELTSKEMKRVQLRNVREQYSSLLKEDSPLVEMAKNVVDELEKLRVVRQKIRESVMEGEMLHVKEEKVEAKLRDQEERLVGINTTLKTLELQLSRRKQGKEDEIRDLKEQVEEGKKVLSEEELELRGVLDTLSTRQELEDRTVKEIQVSDSSVKLDYSTILEDLERFNLDSKEIYDRVDSYLDRINRREK